MADLDVKAMATLVRDAIRFAVWAGGEGIYPADPSEAPAPEDFLFDYAAASGDEDYDGYADAVYDALLSALEPAPAPETAGVTRLREMLGGIHADVVGMREDNLAILLASYFESWADEDEDTNESGTWKQSAVDSTNKALDAIHAHYTAALAAKDAEIAAANKRAEEAEYALRRFRDVRSAQPDFEVLWAEQSERAEQAEARVAALVAVLDDIRKSPARGIDWAEQIDVATSKQNGGGDE